MEGSTPSESKKNSMGQKDLSGRSKRLDRYSDFRIFARLAQDWFSELGEHDARHQFFKSFYSFYVVVGGRFGGVDKRVVEVFYGKGPIDLVKQMSYSLPDGTSLPFPRSEQKLVSEAGASLRYERTVRGTVLCFLEPARSEGLSPQEESIVLAHINEPRILTGKPLIERHWRAFRSYCECSSCDGDPRISDRIRVMWLLFTRPLIIEGKLRERRVATTVKWILKWVATVGMSGAILSLISALQQSTTSQ
jgi:hypothetical protein